MFDALRARQPGAPLWRILWWHVPHYFCFVFIVTLYRYRAWGVNRIPSSGPLLIVSNHQSFLDPALIGLSSHKRQFHAMARSTLFRNPVFAWLIRSLNAVPVERGESDIAAMRRCIDALSRGNALLVFPEGTRTLDGTTRRFATGTMLLIKRARPTVLPVAIEGAFEAWPKGRAAPKLCGRIGVMFGEPIEADRLIDMGAPAALEHLRDTIETMRLDIARRSRKI